MSNALEIRGLSKSFEPGFKLGPLNLTVPAGAIYGFVGPNGAGKTTTIDLIFGMGGKDAGSISVFGLDHLRDEVEMKRHVGYISPELDFRAWGRIGRAIDFVRGFYPSWDEGYCDHLLASFDLNRADKIGTLSFGAKIKLTIVLALAWRPRLLVLDEPTVGLDAISRQQLFAELLAVVHDESRAVFISSHAIADVERIADHVGMIKNGQLVFEGSTDEVIDRFRIVDFVAADATSLDHQPGVVVQRREQDRWRVLIDRSVTSIERLTGRGARPVSDAPVSLEELFVALGR